MQPWLDIDGGLGRSDVALSGMLQAVRTGRPVYESTFGREFWEDLEADPDRGRAFDALMAVQVSMVADEVTTAYDWSDVRRVVDVGGGTGTLLAALLTKYPTLLGTLVDLPSSVEAAGATWTRRAWPTGAPSSPAASLPRCPPTATSTSCRGSCTTGATAKPARSSAAAPKPPGPPAGCSSSSSWSPRTEPRR